MARTTQDRKTRTLPLPKHEVPTSQQSSADVLDGEIVDEERLRKQAQREHADGERLRQRRAQSIFGYDPQAQLRADIDNAGRTYMKRIQKANLAALAKKPKEQAARLDGIHRSYASMMVLSCLQPLSEGLSAKSVLSVAGMGAAMWMLSPNFRTQVGEFAGQIEDAAKERIQERKQSKIDKVITKTSSKSANGKPLSTKWEDRLHKAQKAQRGGREMFTAWSAGMTEVALSENVYRAMRTEGADVEALMDAHKSMLVTLYEQAAEDGIDPEEVSTAARTVIGRRLEEEPGLSLVFGDLAHGQFAKSGPREVVMSGTGELAMVWTGEFENRLGQPVEGGSFAVRPPMDADQHQAAITETMTMDMVSLVREQGVEGLNVGFVSYAAAWGLKDKPAFSEMVGMDNHLGERLRTSLVMRSAMNDDAVSDAEQQRIYSNAYVDALENIGNLYPEAEIEWAARFGDNWRSNMRDFVSNPETYMNSSGGAEARTPGGAAREAGPAGTPEPESNSARGARKHRSARINQNYIATAATGLTGFGTDPSDHRDQDFELGG